MKIIMTIKKNQELVTSVFLSFFFNDPYHLNILDALIQRGFCAIPKFAIDNLCKPFQDGTIISFSISF